MSRRILVVEDHRDSATALGRILTHHGHQVRVTGTLADAIKLCRESNFDLILCDIGLPDGSGLNLARLMKTECPQTKLIAFTGYGMPPMTCGRWSSRALTRT
jgi:CheY-like chemotaxis protein